MEPVELIPVEDRSLVLRARGSELLITEDHVTELRKHSTAREFTGYFLSEALVNRSARKLFEAWLRKDQLLWQRLYKTIHHEMGKGEAPATTTKKVEKPEPKIAKSAEPAVKKAPKQEKIAEKPAEKKAAASPKTEKAVKESDKKVTEKPKAKAAPAPKKSKADVEPPKKKAAPAPKKKAEPAPKKAVAKKVTKVAATAKKKAAKAKKK